MSQENVELARTAYEALQRDDIEACVGYVHPEAEWHSLVLEMEGSFHGREGVRQWWASLTAAFPNWKPSILELRDLGDFVLFHSRGIGSGAGSGVAVDEDFWQVTELREGLIVWYASFRTESEALEAVGLRE
jgi:ketosteroid isomerase-like protein